MPAVSTKKEPAISKAVPQEPMQIVLDGLGRRIEANLAGLYLTVRRPSGRPQMKEVKIETQTVDMDQATVTKEDVTRPCWKIDVHPLWDEIDKNKAKIDNLLTKFSVSASVKGEHLISMLKIGELLKQLNALRNQRLALADQMRDKWKTEIIPGLASKFPQFFANQISDRLPDPNTLRDRFDVWWVIRPLTPMNNKNMDLSALSEEDARTVIKRNEEFVQKLARQRFQTIFDEVFGEVMTLCNDISSGEYKFGKRRKGALEEILNLLERVNNFGMFANEEVIRRTEIAAQTIRQFNINQVNTSTTVQDAIKNAMKPLGQALKDLTEQEIGNTRARRSVDI